MNELAYVLITPYSILKSRTGGIIGRLMAQSHLRLMAVRMCVFSDDFIDDYSTMLTADGADPRIAEGWKRYVDENLRKENPGGFLPRCMLMLFSGPDAVRTLREDVIGGVTREPVGDNVRGTYGDFICDAGGDIRYFEPAVITAPNSELNLRHLKLLSAHVNADGGILTGQCKYPAGANVEACLVMLKPDNIERPTRQPGHIIDVFSRSGLRIVGTKLFKMTVAMAEEFYGPLKQDFVTRLRPNLTREIHSRLGDAFSFPFTMIDAEQMSGLLAERNATAEFNRIVEFMSGVNPDEITNPTQKKTASRTRCLAMLYEGPDAITKIRRFLGSTDPTKAEPATVRSEFGKDLMRNGAHASDGPPSATRERRILEMDVEEGDCDAKRAIDAHLKEIGQ